MGLGLCENTKPLDRDRMSYSFKTALGARSEDPFNFESNSRNSFSSRFARPRHKPTWEGSAFLLSLSNEDAP
jgi:hypothetical protein